MREALFIKQHKDKWLKSQHTPAEDADETAGAFTQLVDDLSYAKTFYPHSRVTRYLNARASQSYMNIYQSRKEERSRITEFWKYTVPLTVRRHHGVLLFCAALFITFFITGFYSSQHDETFVREMLSDSYVNMTEENIEKGDQDKFSELVGLVDKLPEEKLFFPRIINSFITNDKVVDLIITDLYTTR